MSAPLGVVREVELEGTCRTAGCTEQHRHPITGATPDYHWRTPSGKRYPRWKDPFKGAPKPADRWYRVVEIAQIAGVSAYTVRRWIAERGLKASRYRGGRILFIRGGDLTEFLEGQPDIAPIPVRVSEQKRPRGRVHR